MSDGKHYQIFVRVDEETGKKFEELIKRFTTPLSEPTKVSIVEMAIKELHQKYIKKGSVL